MATIIGAIASSHTPTIGFALDAGKQQDPAWAPIFAAYAPVSTWLAEARPDVLLVIYNDHVTSFFFDHYSAFALGVGESWSPADEGGGPRALPPVSGHPALARHVGASLMADEFDMSFFQHKALDHGCFSPLSVMVPHDAEAGWPVSVIPLQVGVLQAPAPSARRCYKLGQAIRRAVESYPEDLRVAVVATGGLSHQVHGERCGFNNTAWDHKFLDLFESDPEALLELTHADYARLGGFESAEVVMWMVMRGAMAARIECKHRDYYLPSMTGIAVAVYENHAADDRAMQEARAERQRERIGHQLRGIEQLEGTYPFSLETSVRAYRINRYLHQLVLPAFRERFRADPAATFDEADLTAEERDLITRRDWRGMIHYGVIFFLLEKLGAVSGVSNLHIYAAMRGQSLEDFQKTRNAPGALYSVSGGAGQGADWAGQAAGGPTPR
ncbi:protocatechuate 4,5-dioxygenase alpha subunit /protocatechuate 4,5-dioxygenase beta subunit [Cupriavidus sp. OV038]|jgi:gallate dioxygenase|uniref:Gallate dioxygenase n=1 Tax=Cupriavidus campinensis TaxID=151783 RepID=A0AAE9I7Q5_9BURK|nr:MULTISPECIES: gallate dioxygenase [Cupriavidus]URF06640.1 gallate dioxygenase [Cupriavidus campinensis]SFC38239.1 protocatechuate 4,5-dioxygenase alpha subunit /protocatechuate 4,5-dioxygenase beta subunit [Cupriavidus sp. OV038]SFP28861.1 protocatechuate 4,5-dioxygenase alpha subunit /protocatechuate 4,5-dioxygenase beta subunit [Cupriavidus sp. OV096]